MPKRKKTAAENAEQPRESLPNTKKLCVLGYPEGHAWLGPLLLIMQSGRAHKNALETRATAAV